MNLEQAKVTFIDQWGAMASVWGVPRSMSQVYALLLIQSKPLNTDDMMEALSVSRGNISMTMKDLMEWGLVYKVFKPGDRKDYYEAEKDMWIALRRIVEERKRKELDPMMRQLERLSQIKGDGGNSEELLAFNSALNNVIEMGSTVDNFLGVVTSKKKVKIFKWLNKIK